MFDFLKILILTHVFGMKPGMVAANSATGQLVSAVAAPIFNAKVSTFVQQETGSVITQMGKSGITPETQAEAIQIAVGALHNVANNVANSTPGVTPGVMVFGNAGTMTGTGVGQ